MIKRKRGLGNLGVDVLLSTVETAQSGAVEGAMQQLAVDLIRRGRYQPRAQLDPEALEELAASIRAQGLVQPVVVRPAEGGYELIAGERRWRAAQLAGLDQIPAVVKSIPDQAAAAMSLIENIQREDLNPLEEAGAFQRLITEFELTHQQVAEAVGRSRAAVSNALRLLELGQEAKQLLQNRELEMGHARALLALTGVLQAKAARHIATRRLSVRETERYVASLLTDKSASKSDTQKDPDIARLEQSLAETLGAPVQIRHQRSGKGTLIIRYTSLDELDGVLSRIKGSKPA